MKTILKLLKTFVVGNAGPRVKLHLLAMIRLRESGYFLLARIIAGRLQRKHGVFISYKADFPRSLSLRHPVGIIVGEGVKLGERVTIYQNVTLGGARIGDAQAGNYPEIGDDTVIFAGAVIVGKVKIGRHCVVGANAVVTKDIPDYATVAGIPARVIRQRSAFDFPTEPI